MRRASLLGLFLFALAGCGTPPVQSFDTGARDTAQADQGAADLGADASVGDGGMDSMQDAGAEAAVEFGPEAAVDAGPPCNRAQCDDQCTDAGGIVGRCVADGGPEQCVCTRPDASVGTDAAADAPRDGNRDAVSCLPLNLPDATTCTSNALCDDLCTDAGAVFGTCGTARVCQCTGVSPGRCE